METSLHRQLKELYAAEAPGAAQTEALLGDYRIDVRTDDWLIEVQHGSLAAIRTKVQRLLEAKHSVLIVKPIVVEKTLVRLDRRGGRVVSRRRSPKRGTLLALFDDLVYFTRVYPQPRLAIEAVLVDTEEHRYPGHGKRRRRRERDFQIEDQRLLAVRQRVRLQTAQDLLHLLGGRLPRPFHTGQLAEHLGVRRWIAQRIAYCLRETGATRPVGKEGNALLYEAAPTRRRAARKRQAG